MTRAFATFDKIPATDVGALRPGSLYVAYDSTTRTYWGTASFVPSAHAGAAVSTRFQDGGGVGIFTSKDGKAWKMTRIGGEPFPCAQEVPAIIETAWGVKNSAYCPSSSPAKPLESTRAATVTASSIARIAEEQVGVGDAPASTKWSLDCDPYTTLVGVAVSSAGCGVNPGFDVRNRNELWCADFAKWVWEHGGVTSDLGALNPDATSFYTWGRQNGDVLTPDGNNPAVGDAVVFYPEGAMTGSGLTYADHVGIVIGVNANGTVDLVNGDFVGSRNISVQENDDVSIASWASAVWSPGERWMYISSRLPPATGTDLAENGGFNLGSEYWSSGKGASSTNLTTYANGQNPGTNPYEGKGYAAISTAEASGSIFQAIPATIRVGDTYCASPEVVTVGEGSGGGGGGGSGALALWLIGDGENENSVYSFSALPGGNDWTPVSTCVTATTSHTELLVQIYPEVDGPIVGVDAVDVQPDLVENGGFNLGSEDWSSGKGATSTNLTTYANGQNPGTNAYEGKGYAAISTAEANGSIFQAIPATISAGDTYCASAELVTVGEGSGGGRGALALWLIGDGENENSVYSFSDLPGGDNWTPVSTCVTATTSHTELLVQIYPQVDGPIVGVDAVDVQPDLVENGGFNLGSEYWSSGTGPSFTNLTTYANGQIPGTNAYEGKGYAAINTAEANGSIFQAIPATISAGETYCASAEVVTVGDSGGGSGALALWLIGDGENENSVYSFSNLPGGDNWTPVSTCVTATTFHTDVLVQIYPEVDGPTIGVDDVDSQAKGGVSYPAPSVLTSTLPTGTAGSAYTAPLSATGGVSPYAWTITSGSLPAGLTLSPSGLISGTPTSAGTSTFAVQVSDSSVEPMTASQPLSLTIATSGVATAAVPAASRMAPAPS
jgi:hypothetical protein